MCTKKFLDAAWGVQEALDAAIHRAQTVANALMEDNINNSIPPIYALLFGASTSADRFDQVASMCTKASL